MGAGRDDSLSFVSILQDPDGGAVWLHVQLPSGRLLRGPYGGLEEAQRAATAMERVARHRWAQDGGEPDDGGGHIGGPAPLAWTTVDPGKEPGP